MRGEKERVRAVRERKERESRDDGGGRKKEAKIGFTSLFFLFPFPRSIPFLFSKKNADDARVLLSRLCSGLPRRS